jgi:hypothetical protein
LVREKPAERERKPEDEDVDWNEQGRNHSAR